MLELWNLLVLLISDRIRLYNYRMFVCYCSFHGAHRYKVHDSTRLRYETVHTRYNVHDSTRLRYETVHDSTRLRYETVFIRYTVHDSTRTLDMKMSIRNKVHDSTKPIDMYVTLDTRQE